MTRAAWERTITDSAGNVLTGVQIAVFQQDGTTPATIYGQLSGGAALANPFNTGVQTSAKFYADPGRYVIRAVKDGQTKEFTDVDIADKAIRDDVGTAAYLAATTSTADRTVGRAMRVGDYGLGVSVRGVVDIFTILTPAQIVANAGDGFLYEGSIQNHGASAPSTFGILSGYITSANGYSYAYQDFTDLYGGKWTRTAQVGGAGWNPWTPNYTGYSAVGPVSVASGVNNGAIIESGSNASGNFVKFADGTMIAWADRTGALGMSNYTGVSGLHSGEFIWAYPVAFAYPPRVFGSGADQSRVGWASSYNVDGNRAYMVYFSASATVSALFAQMVAIGRWRA